MKKLFASVLAIVLLLSSISLSSVSAANVFGESYDTIASADDALYTEEKLYLDDEDLYFDDDFPYYDYEEIELTPEEQAQIDALLARAIAKDYTAFREAEELDYYLYSAFYNGIYEYMETLSEEEQEIFLSDLITMSMFTPPVDSATLEAYMRAQFPGYTDDQISDALDQYMNALSDEQIEQWQTLLITSDNTISLDGFISLCASAAYYDQALKAAAAAQVQQTTQTTAVQPATQTVQTEQSVTTPKATTSATDNPKTGVEDMSVAFAAALFTIAGLAVSKKIKR